MPRIQNPHVTVCSQMFINILAQCDKKKQEMQVMSVALHNHGHNE